MTLKTLLSISLFIISLGSLNAQTQIGNTINGLVAGDRFGSNTAISSNGTIIAAAGNVGETGAGGSPRVFQNLNGVWTLYGTDNTGDNFGNLGCFSISLSSDGNTFAFSGLPNEGVRIFSYNSNTQLWNQKGSDILNTTSVNRFGYSIKLSADGNIVAIGTPDSPIVPIAGVTQIYRFESGSWNQIGSNIVGLTATEHSGRSIDLSADGTIVGILNDTSARVYQNNADNWILYGNEIAAIGSQSPDKALSLSSNGMIIAIGEPDFNGGLIQQGRVRTFRYEAGIWNQIGQDILGEVAYYRTGWSVSLSGDGSLLVIGEIGSTSGSTDEGRTRIFQNQNNQWVEIGNPIFGTDSENYSGWSVVLSGDGTTLISGAPQNDANGTEAGHIRAFSIDALLSTDEIEATKIQIYPNPSHDEFTIILPPNSILKHVRIYDNQGRLVVSVNQAIIDTFRLASGIYFVDIMSNKGRQLKRLIVD